MATFPLQVEYIDHDILAEIPERHCGVAIKVVDKVGPLLEHRIMGQSLFQYDGVISGLSRYLADMRRVTAGSPLDNFGAPDKRGYLSKACDGLAVDQNLAGVLYDLTGSYTVSFLNAIAFNLLNMAIAALLLRRARRCMLYGFKQMLIKPLMTYGAIEAFNVRILCWFARLNESGRNSRVRLILVPRYRHSREWP